MFMVKTHGKDPQPVVIWLHAARVELLYGKSSENINWTIEKSSTRKLFWSPVSV